MKRTKEELIKYRIERAYECLEEAKIMAETNHWNTVANRLYYACFYMLSALNIKNATLHHDIKTEFQKAYIDSGLIDKKYGDLYNELFVIGQDDDENISFYLKQQIEPYMSPTVEFVNLLKTKISNP